ncbi:MAG: PQQ-binding-like beta-propeller repeat protein [Planctomycetia bacterium]|nr:PQQ-binding-like beta-propeller repeat protein [Planctomycetia bacterium]
MQVFRKILHSTRTAAWLVLVAVAVFAGLPPPVGMIGAADEPPQGTDRGKKQSKKDGEDAADVKNGAKAAEKKDPAADGEKEKKQPAEKKEPPKALQPIRDMFKRNPVAGTAVKKATRAGIDGRAPSEKRSDDLIRKARAAIAEDNWTDALELLQRIAELPEDTLYRLADETGVIKWVSLHHVAQRLIGQAPAESLERYRAQFGGLSKQLLADAGRSGDPADFARIARVYFHTASGYEAANRIGSWHLDRSETALAAQWFGALWNARPALTQSPVWRAKAALALARAGQAELARSIFDVSAADASTAAGAVGGGSRTAARWLASSPELPGPFEAPLAEWPMFFGTPRRTGVAAGGEPLLLRRWHIPLTDRQPVQFQIDRLLEDLSDQGTNPLPLIFPVMVGGKIVFRTLHGVQVVDAGSGRLLWETEELQPLENLIAASGGQAETFFDNGFMPGRMIRGMRFANAGFYNASGGENSPLCHLLFRNANFGLTSSDGRRLFVVEDPMFFTTRQPGFPMNWDASAGISGSSGARLAAYDLETGRPLWEVGGASNGEAFDPPLAGYFFFGAPVADADELFVIGESTSGDTNKQIRLVCLDPETGSVKWTQLVASADPDIEKDLCRRWWTAQVAVADGMLICPTTVGWTVAVDRLSHTLLWGHRSATPARPNPGAFGGEGEMAALLQIWPLKDAWGPAPPVVAGGYVICTSPESQTLFCLDQITGKEQWSKPRGTASHFAGISGKHAVIVAKDQVFALQLENGTQVWATKTAAPAGRGVLAAGRFYLPVAGGPVAGGPGAGNEVWQINLQTGEVVAKLSLPDGGSTVGNLAMYHGMLLSADPSGLTAFEQRDAVHNEIKRRKQQDPRDPRALVREAQVHVSGQNLPAALASLRQVPREKVPPELQETYRSLIARVLSSTIRDDYARASADADLAELASVVATPLERQNLRRLEAGLFLARGQFERAFDVYLAMADESHLLLAREDAPAVEVRSDRWAAGKFSEMMLRLSDVERAAIDRRIADLQTMAADSDKSRMKFITLFRGRPEAAAVGRDLAEKEAERGDFAAAERLLLQLADEGDRSTAAAAIERLARLMLKFELSADAAAHYLDLERRFGDVPLQGGITAAKLVQDLRDAGKFPDAPAAALDWHAEAIRVERHGVTGFSNFVTQELTSLGSNAPFFSNYRLEVEASLQRLDVVDAFSEELRWTVPLRSRGGNADGNMAAARAAGHQVTLLHQGVLHGLSPVDRRVLWTKPVESRVPIPNLIARNLNAQSAMQSASNLANRQAGLQARAAQPGALCLANGAVVATLGRRNLTVLDALNGEVVWTHSGLRTGTIVLGGEHVVYLRPPDGQNPVALRAVDGTPILAKQLADTLNRFVHEVNDNFVMSGLAGGKPGLRLFDPVAGRDLWSFELNAQAKISILDNDRAAILDTDGKFALVDLQSGKRRELATILADDLGSRTDAFVVADHTNLFLLLNKGPPSSSFSDQVPFIRASGTILAFDLESGKQRWKQAVQQQNLLLERLTASPYLLFSNREYKQRNRLPVWSLHLVAIDKLSGEKLLDEKSISQPGFRSVIVNAADRYIELRSYNERLRLYPADRPAAGGQSGG